MSIKSNIISNFLNRSWDFSTEKSQQDFKVFYQDYQNYVRKTLYWLVGHEPLDDLVQETFIKVWKSIHRFSGHSHVKTWIYRIATNVAIDYLRKNKTEYQLALAEHNHPSHSQNNMELSQLIDQAILSLPIKLRVVFVLYYKQELTLNEISDTLNTAEGTIKSRLFKSRNLFKDYLEKHGVSYE